MTKYCANCGRELKDEAKYCPECGQECWKSNDMNEKLMRWDFNALCTECAIKEEFNQKL